MNSRHVKRIASPQVNWGQRETYFAPAMERRLWRGRRSFPGRPVYGRFRPIEAFEAAVRNGGFTSKPVGRIDPGVRRRCRDRICL
jgi:hypothetical protein